MTGVFPVSGSLVRCADCGSMVEDRGTSLAAHDCSRRRLGGWNDVPDRESANMWRAERDALQAENEAIREASAELLRRLAAYDEWMRTSLYLQEHRHNNPEWIAVESQRERLRRALSESSR